MSMDSPFCASSSRRILSSSPERWSRRLTRATSASGNSTKFAGFSSNHSTRLSSSRPSANASGMSRRARPLIAGLLLGADAGAAATWAMDQATAFLYEQQSDESKERENEARGGKTAYEIAAEKGAR